MTRTTPAHSRLERYALFAALPTVGIGGSYAFAGDSILHYGGPAIEITRSFATSFDNIFISSGSALVPGFDMAGFNFYEREVKDNGVTKSFREAGLEADSDKYFGVTEGIFGEMLAAGDQISIDSREWAESEVILAGQKSVTDSSTTIFQSTVGDWALDDGDEEARGFLAFALDEENPMFGWLDIGWDNETLTIYDFALNTDGNIAAGQTSSATAVPGAGGLAALAMGAAGIRRRRKKGA